MIRVLGDMFQDFGFKGQELKTDNYKPIMGGGKIGAGISLMIFRAGPGAGGWSW
jgi:hypothetical protein